ncbi:hypothetical protein SDRG_17362 [Saprolegnia diclina VS20]|uniref:Uncharacterized protein n=1 Tax=Saprolegnia diclina (strain VS20) TaxID=1156394 RepID=T0PUR4_SAPDV|nr:hypothetical protein SDRG_17362 [Saprolegnia diclina VS20]EQC24745.1 hypothetical protein SDRG_17362 [Saprolegnia diclina VS20]|eukprot:XP_008621826.1 hypothetical protein SDRG_17362 [Saprolegnia diclina VS20]
MMDLVAMSGDLELLMWLHEAGAICSTAAMDGAAMNGHYDDVLFLHSARTEGCTIAAATAAAVNGDASIVRFLLEQRTEGVDPSLWFKPPHREHLTHSVRGETYIEAVDLVAATVELTDRAFKTIVDKRGLVVLQLVYSRGYLKKMTKPLLELAVAKQDHAMLRYVPLELLHKSRLRVGSERAIVYAAYRSHMHVLDWLHTNRRDGCDQDAMALAVATGRLDVVRWLHEVYGLWRTHAALATAAYIGHMTMVTYLLDIPTGGVDCWTDQVDSNSNMGEMLPPHDDHLGSPHVDYVAGSPTYWAASQGHLEILQLLVARDYELPLDAIEKAVANGHLYVVRYLHEGFSQRCNYQHVLVAVQQRHVDTVAYVLSNGSWQLDDDLSNDEIASEVALHMLLVATARSGSLDILALVHAAFPIPTTLPARVSERMMIRAASYGHLDMLRHLHDVYGFGWTPMVEEAARRRGRKNVLRYLQTLGPANTSVDTQDWWNDGIDACFPKAMVDGVMRVRSL